MTLEELLEEIDPNGKHVYTREQIEADHKRLLTAIAAKHGITEAEVPALIAEHRYVHSEDDIEDEYIQVMAFMRISEKP